VGSAEPFPIEECRARSSYVVRAEIPGLEPGGDITVVVADNDVTIEVRRPLLGPERDDGVFHEPTVKRRIRLPRGARDETLTATYHADGILELVVDLPRPAPIGRVVPVGTELHCGGGQP
jgi:HSP20 family molecular chaperone IbpA